MTDLPEHVLQHYMGTDVRVKHGGQELQAQPGLAGFIVPEAVQKQLWVGTNFVVRHCAGSGSGSSPSGGSSTGETGSKGSGGSSFPTWAVVVIVLLALALVSIGGGAGCCLHHTGPCCCACRRRSSTPSCAYVSAALCSAQPTSRSLRF